MRTASRLLIGSVLAVLLSCPAHAADTPPPPNYQGLWWNSPSGSEAGWGINFAHQGDMILATWFTYDTAGDGWWLVMNAGKTAEGTYSGTLLETAGPAFSALPFDPLLHTRTTVGSGTLAFRDADNGTFRYSVRGVEQAKPITRQVYGPLPTCTFGTQPDMAAATNYQDMWWVAGGAESGWGINLAHQGDVIFATWFTYDSDGSPMWLAVNAPRIAPGVYGGKLIRTTGPAFSATPFDPAMVTRTDVGTATFTFANGNAATFAYTLGGVSRAKAITRQLFAPPAGTRCRAPEPVAIEGRVFVDGYLEHVLVCADANGNARCDPDEAQVLSDAAGDYELTAPAGFRGPLAAEVVAGQSRGIGPSGTTVDRSYRMASPSRDYGTHITPFATLVQLAKARDFRLAEERVRNDLGLAPGFRINLDAAPADGSLAQAVAKSLVTALKATAALDHSSPEALARVVAALPPALTELPHLAIRTKDGAPIVSKEVYVDATFTLTNPAASVPQAELNGKIRGRGNTTWLQDKKPYKVQFTNDAAYAKVPDFLGMKKNRNWALLADHLDRTLMRNKLAFSLGNSSLFADGLKWTPSGQHVEVTLNGDYIGVYLFTEDIRIDAARLNIRKMSPDPAAGQVDGGYIVEVDFPLDCYNQGSINLQHRTPEGVNICIDTPDEDAITPNQIAYIKGFLDAAEREVHAGGNLGTINPVSFADWYLLNELFRNHDAVFYSSDFMWKDTGAAAIPADRLLNMGPVWDFDLSAGNSAYYGNWQTDGCWVTQSLEMTHNWYGRLFNHPDFLDLTLARWKDKRAALETLVNASIDSFARRLELPQARNFSRWPVLGAPNSAVHYVFPTYAGEVAFLKQFLNARMAWLDKAFDNPASFMELCK